MNTFYWILQYIWVLIAYIFIMYIWPSVVFKKHLSGKSRTYRFAFCTIGMVALINLACIVLGMPHLLFDWLYRLIFYGVFLFFLLKDKRISPQTIKKFKNLISGTYGAKSMFSDIFNYLKDQIKKVWHKFTKFMEGHWFEYVTLAVLVLFGMIYFSYGAFQDYSFGCGDAYVHTQWTYQVSVNNIFSSGIYPEGMHFFLYSIMCFFGVPMYSVMIFEGGITSFITLISLFILLREVFKWRYSPHISLALFLIIDIKWVETLFSMCRLQWPLPQEFGFPAMFLCTTYLIRFLRFSIIEKKEKKLKANEVTLPKKKFRIKCPIWVKDENLFLFTLAMSVTIMIHFYSTMMALFLCVGVAVALIRKIFSRKILPLLSGVFAGLLIAIIPFVVCFLSGMRLQGSLTWAMSMFMPSDPEPEIIYEGPVEGDITNLEEENEAEIGPTTYNSLNDDYNSNGVIAANTGKGTSRIAVVGAALLEKLAELPAILITYGYDRIEGSRGTVMFIFTMLAIILWLVLTIAECIRVKVRKIESTEKKSYIGYLILPLMGIVPHLFYCSGALGLPWIMEPYRICTMAVMVGLPVFIVPIDLILDKFGQKIKFKIPEIIAGSLIIILYFGSKALDCFHGYLLYQTTRYNSVVMVTKQISATLPDESFTIVSSTDELYQIIGKSYHEELIEFINKSEVVSYTIPTEYIFIYIEKNPIQRSQYHFFVGPDWLAEEKYAYFYYGLESEGDELIKQTISEEYANVYFGKFPMDSAVYATMWKRVVLNSKAYIWCQKFNAMYPNELHVYYEDDDFLCYYLHQNPRNLYELATMDPSVMVPAEDYEKPIWPSNYEEGMDEKIEENGDN